jgi:hypothetical protein
LSGFGIATCLTLWDELEVSKQLNTPHQQGVNLLIIEIHQQPQHREQMRARPRTLKKIVIKK